METKLTKRLLRDEQGVSAIEYCVLIAMVAVTLIFALNTVGRGVATALGEAEAGLSGGEGGEHGDGENDGEDGEDGDGEDGDGKARLKSPLF